MICCNEAERCIEHFRHLDAMLIRSSLTEPDMQLPSHRAVCAQI
jgi:hypothetical protein